jgi:hypothetical protein
LSSMRNNVNPQQYTISSDESSLEIVEQNSSYTSFCSTSSRHSKTTHENYLIPRSIFLDDLNTNHEAVRNNDTRKDDSDDDECSDLDIDDVDALLNHEYDGPPDLDHSTRGDDHDSTVHSTTSSFQNSNFNNGNPCHHNPHNHRFNEMSRDEIASYKIMALLDTAGAPRICYNRLVALLKKLAKKDGFDVKKALNRETLMSRLEKRYQVRPRIETSIINNKQVFRFTFLDMLQDLLHSSSEHLQNITPETCLHNYEEAGSEHELWNTSWMRNTFALEQYLDFNPNTDIMLPLILYMDKTGTDVNQRYSLEPVLFSLAAIPREQRESRHSWRHLGFIPQQNNNPEEDTTSSLQVYHNFLSYLLDGLREAQQNAPTVTVPLPLGGLAQRRALLPLMIVMGDQLSQDTLCGRLKSNSGGAGRVHRSCMCSYLHIDDPFHDCKKVNIETLNLLNAHARISDEDIAVKINTTPTVLSSAQDARIMKTFLLKQRTMFRSILRHPFTTHPLKNAFDGISFGSWSAGIHDATLDDFMHSVEAGMISYITETVYDGLTKKEKDTIEELTRSMLDNHRCSVSSNYPRWRLQSGFTRQTLMTSGERVGSLLALSLSLHDPTVRDTIRLGHFRQTQKYLDLSPESPAETKKRETDSKTGEKLNKPPPPPPPPEFYLHQHMHALDDQRIHHTLEHMIRHGFQIDLIVDLDPFQINQLVWNCAEIFKNVHYPNHYPPGSIDGLYTDLTYSVNIPKEHFIIVKHALQTAPSKLLKNHRHRKVEGTAGKHLKKKGNKKGEGSSAAVLTRNMGTLVIFLEYVLCYHAFCKYSWSLPIFLQRSFENIHDGNRFVVEYFQKLIYRGNCTVDSRFPKIHAQRRMGINTTELNTVMNFCCETGERLLKTEAKGISSTAQQRGNDTFLAQTMSRLQDRSVLDCFSLYLEKKEKNGASIRWDHNDHFGRTHPHFIYDVENEQIYAVNRKNEQKPPDSLSGYLDSQVTHALKQHEPHVRLFEIFNEVVLRDDSRLRASPNYANSGPWFDYANVTWEKMVNGAVETYLLPARCLCFFRKECQQTNSYELLALIHSVDQFSTGKLDGRADTLLTQNYKMEFDHRKRPITHIVPVASIDCAIRCFPHVPSENLFNPDCSGITHLLSRNHWAYMWMALNDELKDSNSTAKIKQRKGKLNSLCGNQWLERVREKYRKYLHAKCIEDL